MNIVNTILKDEIIQEKYRAIDEINPFPFNHGMKHIKNAVKIAGKISVVFSLTERESEILKVCEILHDLGQVDGRENHGLKAAKFARTYLPKFNYFKESELEDIYSAIETHDECHDYSKLKNKYSWFVNFIDKMDFAKNRLDKGCRKKFGYTVYDDIKSVEFKKTKKSFYIYAITIDNPKILNVETFLANHFPNKAMYTATKFAEHLHLKLSVYIGDEKLDLRKIDLTKF